MKFRHRGIVTLNLRWCRLDINCTHILYEIKIVLLRNFVRKSDDYEAYLEGDRIFLVCRRNLLPSDSSPKPGPLTANCL